jgi:hypothetical protein
MGWRACLRHSPAPLSSHSDEGHPAGARDAVAVQEPEDHVWRELADDPAISAIDLLLAVGVGAARRARDRVVEPIAATATGLVQLGARILSDEDQHPRLAHLTSRSEQLRTELEQSARESVRGLLRWTVEHALAALDLTTLVLEHVDLDALAAGIDVDAVVARTDIEAVIGSLDLNAVAAQLDLDALISRVDLEAVLSRVDLNAVLDSVDLQAVLARVDPNNLVSRVDLDTVLSRIDLNKVAARIDVDAILQRVEPDAVVARVDIDALLERLDLAALAREVIDAIDLPDVLRQSSGAVSSQAARVVRAEGMQADDSVARFVDRVLRRSVPPPRVNTP